MEEETVVDENTMGRKKQNKRIERGLK